VKIFLGLIRFLQYQKPLLIAMTLSLALGIVLSLDILKTQTDSSNDEITQIKASSDLNQQSLLYRHLLNRVGATAAQDMLKNSGLPANGQTHLLNHTTGLYLYQKFGASGLSKCKDYFLESCYHGFLIQAISDHGLSYLNQVMSACQRSGGQVAAQCSHALGHAFLALAGYSNLTNALKTCDNEAKKISSVITYNCYDGVFMENVYGVHDGYPSPNRWIKSDDQKYPCDAQQFDKKYLAACWSNQPALIYQNFSNDLEKTSSLCNSLDNSTYQDLCFGGLNRQINVLTKASSDINKFCGVEPISRQEECRNQNLRSFK
jgi:hypothetical protein